MEEFNTHFYIDRCSNLRITQVLHNERGYRIVAPLVSKDMNAKGRSAWACTKSMDQVRKTLCRVRRTNYAPNLGKLPMVVKSLIEAPLEILKAYTAWAEYYETPEYYEICQYLIEELTSSEVDDKQNKINWIKEVQ